MDRYLSYLSSPPLLHYYSSLWSPAKQKGFRQKQHGHRGRKKDEWVGKTKGQIKGEGREKERHFYFLIQLSETMLRHSGQVVYQDGVYGQMDGWRTPSQEHKPAGTAARGSTEPHTTVRN